MFVSGVCRTSRDFWCAGKTALTILNSFSRPSAAPPPLTAFKNVKLHCYQTRSQDTTNEGAESTGSASGGDGGGLAMFERIRQLVSICPV